MQTYIDHDAQHSKRGRQIEFDQRLGLLKEDASDQLRQLDYSTCYETMDQFPSAITPVSPKSLVNSIAARSQPVFLIKGPPGMGKSHLLSKICCYWARGLGLRKFTLVLWVNLAMFQSNSPDTLEDLLSNLLSDSFGVVNVRYLQKWIESRQGEDTLFVLDDWSFHNEGQSHGVSRRIVSREYLRKSVVLLGSSFTPSVMPSHEEGYWSVTVKKDYTQYELLGLSNAQLSQQVVRYFPSKAEDLLIHLANNPDIKQLAYNPLYLHALLHIADHTPSSDLPTTWTQTFTILTLLLLNPLFPQHEILAHLPQYITNFPNQLPEDMRSLLAGLAKMAYDGLMSEHNVYPQSVLSGIPQLTSVGQSDLKIYCPLDTPLCHDKHQYFKFVFPLLEHFLTALHIHSLPTLQQTTLMNQKQEWTLVWQFYAGLNDKIGVKKLKRKAFLPAHKQYPSDRLSPLLKGVWKKDTRTLASVGYEASHSVNLGPLSFSHSILTAPDIHHILTVTEDKLSMKFVNCCLGTDALTQLSKLTLYTSSPSAAIHFE